MWVTRVRWFRSRAACSDHTCVCIYYEKKVPRNAVISPISMLHRGTVLFGIFVRMYVPKECDFSKQLSPILNDFLYNVCVKKILRKNARLRSSYLLSLVILKRTFLNFVKNTKHWNGYLLTHMPLGRTVSFEIFLKNTPRGTTKIFNSYVL